LLGELTKSTSNPPSLNIKIHTYWSSQTTTCLPRPTNQMTLGQLPATSTAYCMGLGLKPTNLVAGVAAGVRWYSEEKRYGSVQYLAWEECQQIAVAMVRRGVVSRETYQF